MNYFEILISIAVILAYIIKLYNEEMLQTKKIGIKLKGTMTKMAYTKTNILIPVSNTHS